MFDLPTDDRPAAAWLDTDTTDPRDLHDALSARIRWMRRRGQPVPRAMREALNRLEDDIIEAHYDNLPI